MSAYARQKIPAQSSFYWHDYETFGANPSVDFPAQFAGLRTDLILQDAPDTATLNLFCKPPADYLPEPTACAITGITPQFAAQVGVEEPDFAAQIHRALAHPGTTSAGYNSIRFDEEFTRQLFWRNGIDVYTREYANGNARFDLIDVMRLCYALRPEGISWVQLNDKPSFKLALLTQANALAHAQAHDALSDVHATIALARLLQLAQPKLWAHAVSLRHKSQAASWLDYANAKPVLHVSQRFSAERGCMAMVLPIGLHPQRNNQVIVVDLDADPAPLIAFDADEIAERMYVANADLPPDEARLPLKLVHLNRCPMLAPVSALKNVDLARIRFDLARNLAHAEKLKAVLPELRVKLSAAFAQEPTVAAISTGWPREVPALYAGFVPPKDRAALQSFVKLSASERANWFARMPVFDDARLKPLLQIFKARHHAELLSPDELKQYQHAARQNLSFGPRNLQRYLADIDALAATNEAPISLLDALRSYGTMVQQALGADQRG